MVHVDFARQVGCYQDSMDQDNMEAETDCCRWKCVCVRVGEIGRSGCKARLLFRWGAGEEGWGVERRGMKLYESF